MAAPLLMEKLVYQLTTNKILTAYEMVGHKREAARLRNDQSEREFGYQKLQLSNSVTGFQSLDLNSTQEKSSFLHSTFPPLI